MQTFLVLATAAGVAAAVVWRASAPPVTRRRRARAPAKSRSPHAQPAPAGRSFTLPPPEAEPGDVSFVLARAAVPDERPSRLLALLRLAFTIALVAGLAVAIVAALWLVLNGQIKDYVGR